LKLPGRLEGAGTQAGPTSPQESMEEGGISPTKRNVPFAHSYSLGTEEGKTAVSATRLPRDSKKIRRAVGHERLDARVVHDLPNRDPVDPPRTQAPAGHTPATPSCCGAGGEDVARVFASKVPEGPFCPRSTA
jgi:hypothetical protein